MNGLKELVHDKLLKSQVTSESSSESCGTIYKKPSTSLRPLSYGLSAAHEHLLAPSRTPLFGSAKRVMCLSTAF